MSHQPLAPDTMAELLGLEPHPEGGRFSETWRATSENGDRATGTAIYFLLAEGEGGVTRRILGADLPGGQQPQLVVAAHECQSATSLGPWTLVGCTVSPGFEFEGFELAPTGWNPPGTVDVAGR